MKEATIKLIDENTSPLFRIMSVYNSDNANKLFKNNICAFHIGKGIFISVAHNLRNSDIIPDYITNDFFLNELFAKIDPADRNLFNQIYPEIPNTDYRQATGIDNNNRSMIINKLKTAKVDRRYTKLYSDKCCKPFLIASFRNNSFCNDNSMNIHFNTNHLFHESTIRRYTFIIELELLDVFFNEDLAIYKTKNIHNDIINNIPTVEIDFSLYDIDTQNYYCLQSAPYDTLGRIINKAYIKGLLDNFLLEYDLLDNSYLLEGMRYLISGYFRFGSSGAPYLIYDNDTEKYKVNSVQSLACPLQLRIDHKIEGNVQYVNGIASPLSLIQQKLTQRLQEAN